MKISRAIWCLLTLLWLVLPRLAGACPACYGESDSPLAHGMNAGIFTLMGVVGLVLSGVAAFGIFLAHRAGAFWKLEGLVPEKEIEEGISADGPGLLEQ